MAHLKNKLLNTPMTKLGLGTSFNYWFQNDNPLLKDFIADNPLVRFSYDFITSSTQRGDKIFGTNSVYWKYLEEFLIQREFNHTDWLMLLPKVPYRVGKVFDFSLANKKQLKTIPISYVMQLVKSAFPYKNFLELVIPTKEVFSDKSCRRLKIAGKYHCQYLTIGKVLKVNRTMLPRFDTGIFERMRPTLFLIKLKLKELGFTKDDGPFMRLPLSKKNTDAYVNDLINAGTFSKEEAVDAVNTGKKAKWIRTDD